MIRRLRVLLMVSGFLLLCSGGVLWAQATFSTIRGVVSDQTGAVVPGVEVEATETTTNLSRNVISGEAGGFEISELRPGTYRLTVSLPGFKTFVADNIILESAEIRRINVTLELGSTVEEITVQAGASVITTEGGSITTGFDGETFEDIPLVDTYPGPLSMLATTPGIQGDGWRVSVAGQRSQQITQEFDGVSNDRTGGQGANVNMYEEVKIRAVNNTADKSRVASYNMINESGSNEFHGSVWYKHVNSALNAREFFSPVKQQFKLHEFQVEAGGPIWKDKTFFFASYFGERFPAGSFKRSTVPTLQMRQGDFSQLLPGTQLVDPLTGDPFPGNIIPVDRFNPLSARAQDLYMPVPNLGGPDTMSNNLGWAFPYPSDKFATDHVNFRIDHNLTDDNSLFFRYHDNETLYVLARQLPAFNWTRRRSYSKAVISDTHIFSPGLLNTFRFGWNGNYMIDGSEVDGFNPLQGDEAVQQLGLQGVNRGGYSEQGFPRMDFSGFSRFRTISGGRRDDHFDFSWEDSVTYSRNRHVWKFGFQLYKYNDFEDLIDEGTYGRFQFNGRFSGHSWADFLLGLPNWSRRLDPLIPREQEAIELGIYLMDSFKVSPQLTLDYGLRWDYFGSDRIKDGLQYNWDPTTGDVIIPSGSSGQVSPLYPSTINIVEGNVEPNASKSNFRPRLGVAYRMGSDLVIRGGYGVFTERLSYFSRVNATGPFEIQETYTNEITNGQPLFTFPNPFPDLSAAAVPSQSVRGYPVDTKNGLIHQFNLSVEKELGGIGMRVSYVGSRSRNLNYTLSRNKPEPSLIPFTNDRRPFPQFVGTTYWENDGSSNYDSFQIEGKKRVGFFTFNAHYTLASNLHNFNNRENPYNVTNLWSRDNFMQRNRAVITTQTQLPWGRGQQFLSDIPAAADAIIGGWKVVTMSYFATGAHFSPSYSGSDPSNTNSFGGLPDRICDGNLDRGSRSVEKWFDPNCFAVPAAGRFGNSSPNVLVAPGLNVHHLSLAKRFNVRETFDMTFTIAASNIFNHPHFNPPRTNIVASDPGRLTSGIQDWRAEKHASRKFSVKLRLEW